VARASWPVWHGPPGLCGSGLLACVGRSERIGEGAVQGPDGNL